MLFAERHNSENEQIRTLLERQREQILADCQAEIQKHEFQAGCDRRSIPKLNETIESQKKEIGRAHQGDERRRRDQRLLHEQLLKQNWDLREAHEKSLNNMEELTRFQGSTFDTIARRRLVEDQDTILELTGKIQELQNEINCMNDSRDFQHPESVRSAPHPVPGGMLSHSIGMPSRRERPPSIWDTHGISGNVFANPVASSSAPYPQELNPWSSHVSEPIHSSQAGKNGNQTPVQDQRCQSGQSAKNSVIFSGAHPFGCCCDNVGHVHLLGVQHHRRVDGSRRGVCSQKEARYLQRAYISHVPTIKLKLRYQLHRFSTVLDVVNCVLVIPCTRVDSESVSKCVVPSRSDLECQDL